MYRRTSKRDLSSKLVIIILGSDRMSEKENGQGAPKDKRTCVELTIVEIKSIRKKYL